MAHNSQKLNTHMDPPDAIMCRIELRISVHLMVYFSSVGSVVSLHDSNDSK
jgi:hypothetical protein